MADVASVGLGTFLVSFFLALWVVLYIVGRNFHSSGWRFNACGGLMLAIVVIVLATV